MLCVNAVVVWMVIAGLCVQLAQDREGGGVEKEKVRERGIERDSDRDRLKEGNT